LSLLIINKALIGLKNLLPFWRSLISLIDFLVNQQIDADIYNLMHECIAFTERKFYLQEQKVVEFFFKRKFLIIKGIILSV
jgi:hypothetical protein